jgi:hypothetical protein
MDNVMTGTNTLTGDVKISTTSSSLYTDGALVVLGGVGVAENLRVNGRAIFNDILAVYQDVFFYKLVVGNTTTFLLPDVGRHLTNKLRGRVNSDGGGDGDCEYISGRQRLYWFKFFYAGFRHDG